MAATKVPPQTAVEQLEEVLSSPEVRGLISQLEAIRWTGRPGYPLRSMVGACLVKAIYAIPTWSRVVRLIAEHEGLQRVLGAAPSQWACYRFTKQLRERDGWALDICLDRVVTSLREQLPEMGQNVAIDGSDLPAYANGHRTTHDGAPRRISDSDASWGHRSAVSTRKGGGYFGYKIHAAVCTDTDLPLAWSVQTAKAPERDEVLALVDQARKRSCEVRTVIADKGYDGDSLGFFLMQRGIAPVVALKDTSRVQRGEHRTPCCEHGKWIFSGADYKNRRTKWRCPTGECTPASVWLNASRLHPLIPRESKRFKKLYASRSAVEREFGRLKHEWALLPLRVRGLERVRLHADLTVLACLASRLAQERARAVPLAA